MRAILLACVALAPMAAQAQIQACGQRKAMVEHLTQKYGEHQEGVGLMAGANRLYELWTSVESGTWTILMTAPGGIACIIASGQHWRVLEAKGEPI